MNCHPSPEYEYRSEERIVEEISLTGITESFPFPSIHFKSEAQTNPLRFSPKSMCMFHQILLLTGFTLLFV